MTSICKSFGPHMGDTTMNVSVHEDNVGALVLDITFLPQLTLHRKLYVIKTIWFRENFANCGINLLGIDIVDQLGDLFTSFMTRTTFEHLCKKIMGWYRSQIDRIHTREGVLRLSFRWDFRRYLFGIFLRWDLAVIRSIYYLNNLYTAC